MSGPIEAEKADRTRRSDLFYRNRTSGEQAVVDVYGGTVTTSVKLLCKLSGEPDPFPDSAEDTHITRIGIFQFNELMEKAGYEIVEADHKWV